MGDKSMIDDDQAKPEYDCVPAEEKKGIPKYALFVFFD
jgi:hypothetical protein